MTKILLLSDSHSYIDDRILEYASQADEIWHGGDFGNFEVIEQLEKLQTIIFILINGEPKDKIPSGYISETVAGEIKALFKKYHAIKKEVEKDIIEIRNNIGAHRGSQPWTNIMELWDKLDPEAFIPLLVVIPELFDAIVTLDIYDWTRIPEEGSIEFFCSGLNRP